jgi:hypothetical protein
MSTNQESFVEINTTESFVEINTTEAVINIHTTEGSVNIIPIGEQGIPGEGVPEGGSTGQVLAKASNADYDTFWATGGGGGGGVDSVNGYTGIVILDANDVGAYSNTNPQSFINSAGSPVQSVNGQTGTVTLNADDVGAYSNTNPSNFINASGAPIQSVTGTLVTGTGSNPVVNIPSLDQVGAYSNTNPSGFVDATGASAAAPVQSVNGSTGNVSLSLDDLNDVNVASATNGQVLTYNSTSTQWQPTTVTGGGGGSVESVTGDGVNNADPANPVISFPSIDDIGAYSNTNPDNFIDATGAPIQSVTGSLVDGTASDPIINIPTPDQVGAYSNTNPDGFIDITQLPIKTVTGDGVDNTNVGNVVISWPTIDDIGAYSNTNPNNFVDASDAANAAPIQSVTGTLVTGTASDPIIDIPTLDQVGAYSNTNPDGFITAAGAPVQSVNGDTGIVVLTAIDVGAYPDNNPNNFINSAQAPVQSVTGTLVGGTASDPVVNIPTLDQVGAYSNTNPLGFINIAQVPIKTVTGDGVDNTNVGNVVISWPTPDDIGAYSNTNPAGYITSAQAPVQSVNGKTNVVVLDVNDVGAYSNTNPSNFINVAQASAAAPVQSVTGTLVTGTSANPVVNIPTLDQVGAYSNTNPSNFINASGAPVQSVNGQTGVVSLALTNLSDVNTAGVTGGQSLVYNATATEWRPVTVTGGGGSIDSGDTFPVSPALNELFYYTGDAYPNGLYQYFDDGDSEQWVQQSGRVYGDNFVQSVFGRAGAVTANFGDYNASLIQSNTFTGVTATNVQDALEQLGSTKLTAIQTISDKTANYTITSTDAFSLLTMSNASNRAFTIPDQANVAFSNGVSFDIMRKGAGNVLVLSQTGVTLRMPLGTRLRTQNSVATAIKIGTDDWLVTGDMTT